MATACPSTRRTCRGRSERTLGQTFRFVELANDVNEHMPDYVVRRLMVALNQRRQAVKGSRILLLGLAYKNNTGDARESPARRVAELLNDLGADLQLCDGHVMPWQVPSYLEHVDFSRRRPARPPTRWLS